MKKISKKLLIESVGRKWRKQYPSGCEQDKQEIYEKLIKEKLKSEKKILEIIGNSSWTEIECNECEASVSVAIQLGQEPDYDSSTSTICKKCLVKAIFLINSPKTRGKE